MTFSTTPKSLVARRPVLLRNGTKCARRDTCPAQMNHKALAFEMEARSGASPNSLN